MGRMRRFLTNIWKSASDLSFYQEVGELPFRAACRHFLTVAGAFSAILAAMAAVELVFMNNLSLWCRDNLPPVTIRNGEARAEVAQPHLIERKFGGGALFAVIIDTTGKTERVDPRYIGGILIKRRSIVFTLGETSIERTLAGVENLRSYFNGLVRGYRRIALYVSGFYGALMLALFLQSVAGALLGKIAALLRGSPLSFRAIMQMSFYALSVAMCMLFLVLFLGLGLHLRYLLGLYVFVHLAFLIGAVLTSGGDESAA